MKRPAFQFYAKDWRGNLKLRRCSDAAKGAWIEILCFLHDSEEYGVARFPLKELVSAVGVQFKSARELVDKGVIKGGDANVPAYVFVPRHAGKNGEPVTLLEASDGPMWYSSRFVRDEYKRGNAGAETRFKPTKPQGGSPPRKEPSHRDGVDRDSPSPRQGGDQGGGAAVASAVCSDSNHRCTGDGYSSAPPPSATAGAENPPQPASDTLPRIMRELRAGKVNVNPDVDAAIVQRWIREGATPGQVLIAVTEARKPGCKPYPQQLPIGYIDTILKRIVDLDRAERQGNEAKVQRTQEIITESRESKANAVPKPADFPSINLSST